jgi:hypothetical protein
MRWSGAVASFCCSCADAVVASSASRTAESIDFFIADFLIYTSFASS